MSCKLPPLRGELPLFIPTARRLIGYGHGHAIIVQSG